MDSTTNWPKLVSQLSNAARNGGVQIVAVCYKVGGRPRKGGGGAGAGGGGGRA